MATPEHNPAPHRNHLRLVNSRDAPGPSRLEHAVRGCRRSMARRMRALQAAGRSVASWPIAMVTRLAHADAVTARFLLDGRGSAGEVEAALEALRGVDRWLDRDVPAEQRAEARAFEMVIRLTDEELTKPLLQPDGAPEEHTPMISVRRARAPRSLRTGLRSLSLAELAALARRLGVRPLDIESADGARMRQYFATGVLLTLRDDHLLSILLATLPERAQRLLASLVRNELTETARVELATKRPVADVVGAEAAAVRRFADPVDRLCAAGLAFTSTDVGPDRLWVPVELQPRIDGILRTAGV